jgi:hypothetical protein
LAVDQHAKNRRVVTSTDTSAVWASEPDDGRGIYVSVFNLADKEQTLEYQWTALGLPKSEYVVRDLWTTKDLGPFRTLKVTLRPHASVLYRVAAKP